MSASAHVVIAVQRDNRLTPLYINRFLPSALKSLSFSSTLGPTNGSKTTIYACGTRELLAAFDVEVVRGGKASDAIELKVLERGMTLADSEGGEVRTMDISCFAHKGEEYLVASYSNGKLRVSHFIPFLNPGACLSSRRDVGQIWRHARSEFVLVGETEGLGKCILSVQAQRVTVDGKERVLVISGQSDGR